MNGTELDSPLAGLRKAVAATEKLLYGTLAGRACRTVALPDLRALQAPLARLTATLEFDCLELAKILTCSPRLLADSPTHKKQRVYDAVQSVVSAKLPPEFQQDRSAGLGEILAAAESGDVAFFVTLGQTLKDIERRKPVALDETRWTLASHWKPRCQPFWPGLAYCTNHARMQFFKILEIRGKLKHPFTRKMTPRNFDTIWRRMGLVSSRAPFISSLTCLPSTGSLRLRFG